MNNYVVVEIMPYQIMCTQGNKWGSLTPCIFNAKDFDRINSFIHEAIDEFLDVIKEHYEDIRIERKDINISKEIQFNDDEYFEEDAVRIYTGNELLDPRHVSVRVIKCVAYDVFNDGYQQAFSDLNQFMQQTRQK